MTDHLIAVIIGLITISGGILGGLKWSYTHIWKPLEAMYKTIYTNKEFMDKVMYNLSPNGGNSLVDKINKLTDKTNEIHEDVKLIKHKQETKTYLDIQPLFECDANGYCVNVNQKWCEITGIGEDDALGYGWINAVHPADAQRVHDEWQRAIRTDTQFKSTYRFYNKLTKEIIPVKGISRIERNKKGEILYVIGTFEIVDTEKPKTSHATH